MKDEIIKEIVEGTAPNVYSDDLKAWAWSKALVISMMEEVYKKACNQTLDIINLK